MDGQAEPQFEPELLQHHWERGPAGSPATLLQQFRLGDRRSGGYNAALLAEVVGPAGRVVSVDIDPEVTARAEAALKATGYADRVQVVLADAAHGLPGQEPFDVVLVTVGAWDIASAWLELLADDGVLVVPLRMNGITRSIAFRREGDHLVSMSAQVCGFVPMQGEGEHPERVFLLPDEQSRQVRLRFDTGAPPNPELLDGALASDSVELWSGVTIAHQTSFADLCLWFACFMPGFCKVAADEGTDLADGRRWFPFGVVLGGSFAYLVVRPAMDGAGVEFGARAYGPDGQAPAGTMVAQIRAWDRQARYGPAPTFGYWPAGSDRSRIRPDAAVLEKTHGVVTISWPTP